MSVETNNNSPWEMFTAAYPAGNKNNYNSIEKTKRLRYYYNSNQEETTKRLDFEKLLVDNGYVFFVIGGEKHWFIK